MFDEKFGQLLLAMVPCQADMERWKREMSPDSIVDALEEGQQGLYIANELVSEKAAVDEACAILAESGPVRGWSKTYAKRVA